MNKLRRLIPFFVILVTVFLAYSCTDPSTGPGDTPEFNSKAAPGDSAQSFLTGRNFSTLNLEIDYMPGHEPSQQALDSLRVNLSKYLNKSSINIQTANQIPSGGQNTYSATDVRNLEEQHRTHFTETASDTLWAYFIIVDGEYSQSSVLGIAYYNTSMAFFGPTIESASDQAIEDERWEVEAVSFRHEFGHILGLVNNGTPMQQDHQTDGHHCNVDDCVMQAVVETVDFFANTVEENLRDFKQLCRQDMQANGGK